MPILSLIKTVLGIFFWFLKRKPAKHVSEWKDDLKNMDKALAEGDDELISLGFERLRQQSNHNQSGQGVGMPRRNRQTMQGE